MTDMELSADTRNQLADFVERIESLNAEKTETNEKIKAEFSGAAGLGFDKDAIKAMDDFLKTRKTKKTDGDHPAP